MLLDKKRINCIALLYVIIVLGAANTQFSTLEIDALVESTDMKVENNTNVDNRDSLIIEPQEKLIFLTNAILITNKESIIVDLPKEPLEGEGSLMIEEFQDIMRLYNNSPSNISSKIQLYRRLLIRLNKMEVNTSFLDGKIEIMKAAIRYKLGIRGTAESGLRNIVNQSPLIPIREEATRVFLSYNYVNGNKNAINSFIKHYSSYLPPELNTYLQVVNKSLSTNITQEEAVYLMDTVILAPLGSYQHEGIRIKLLNNIQDQITIEKLQSSINVLLYEENDATVVSLMRLMVKKTEVDKDVLINWGDQLGVYEKDLVDTVRIYRKRFSQYQQYVNLYDQEYKARSRGRVFHSRLYAYRGMDNAPYNVRMVKRNLNEYLKGSVEREYLEKNAKRAFRNLLAYKQYDDLIKYAGLMKEKMAKGFVSPYINFWEAYSLLIIGKTNEAVPILGAILTKEPESYYGLMAQKSLKEIIRVRSFSVRNYINNLRELSVNSQQAQLNYAYVLYYIGNIIARKRAENIFRNQGLIISDNKLTLSTKKSSLMDTYLKLGLEKDARQLAFHDGIFNIYAQDLLFNKYYTKMDQQNGIIEILGKRQSAIQKKPSFTVEKEILKTYYPRPYQTLLSDAIDKSERKMDNYLIYSVMRVESFYKEKARSRAGAQGLMQIMPVTGKWLIGKYLPELQKYSLYTPNINIYLGSVYLYDNINAVGLLPALAAYNSGPTFMRKLSNKYNPYSDLELVEIHPKLETRNYVKKVIENYTRYSFLYNNNPQHSL